MRDFIGTSIYEFFNNICAIPSFHPERRLPAQAVAGVSGDWFLTLEPPAMGWFDEIRKVEKNLPFWRNTG
jgi:hypothetical protein